MAIGTLITCDVRGRMKQETNHWLVCVTMPATSTLPEVEGIAFAPIDAATTDPQARREHICGEGCANKRLSQYLTALKLSTKGEAQ